MGDLGVDVRIILKWIFEEEDVKLWTIFKWLGTWSNDGIFLTS
jgi:hypothetical protein